MSESRNEKLQAENEAAAAAGLEQLEPYAVNYQGWYIDHGIMNRPRNARVSASRPDVSNTRAIMQQKASNEIASNTGSPVPRLDIEKHLQRKESGSENTFLVIGVAIHPALVVDEPKKFPNIKLQKEAVRQPTGINRPQGDQLIGLLPATEDGIDNLVLVVTPLQPEQGKVTCGALLLSLDANSLASDMHSTAMPAPYIIPFDQVFLFAEFRDAETASVNRQKTWKQIIVAEIDRSFDAGSKKANDQWKIQRYRHQKEATQLVMPYELGLRNELLMFKAHFDKSNDIVWLKEARDALEAADKDLKYKPRSASALINFLDFEDDFEPWDMEPLQIQLNELWPNIEHVTPERLLILRAGIVEAKVLIEYRFARAVFAEGVYLIRASESSKSSKPLDKGQVVIQAVHTAKRVLGSEPMPLVTAEKHDELYRTIREKLREIINVDDAARTQIRKQFGSVSSAANVSDIWSRYGRSCDADDARQAFMDAGRQATVALANGEGQVVECLKELVSLMETLKV